MTTRILIAEITGAHGVRGLVKIRCHADDPGLLETGPVFTSEGGDAALTIALKNPQKSHWIAEVSGVATRESAEALRGTKLYLARDALPEPDDGETYYIDLIGLIAQDAQQGTALGKIVSVQNFGAGDLLEIKPPDGSATFFVPYTAETVPHEPEDGVLRLSGAQDYRL